MIHKLKYTNIKIGTYIDRNITLTDLKELLYSGVCIHEATDTYQTGRVLFCWKGQLYVRCIHDTLGYIQNLPNRLRDSSYLDDGHIQQILGLLSKSGGVSLYVLALTKDTKQLLKDFK